MRREGLAVRGDGVQAVVEVDGVEARSAGDGRHVGGLVRRADGVVARSAVDGVHAGASADLVVAGPAADDVGAGAAVDGVGAVAAVEDVGLVAAVDLIVPGRAVDGHRQVQPVVHGHGVVSGAEAEDHARIAAGRDAVDAARAHARTARRPDRDPIDVVDAQVAVGGAERVRLVVEAVGRREAERRAVGRHRRGGMRAGGQGEGEGEEQRCGQGPPRGANDWHEIAGPPRSRWPSLARVACQGSGAAPAPGRLSV